MTKDIFEEFAKKAEEYGCAVTENAELKPYTSFKIGGRARLLVKICSESACCGLLEYADINSVPIIVLGKGSNVLVDDRGVEAAVLLMSGDFGGISLTDETTIRCEAGASLSRLCCFALENGLTGLEFAYGIPGSVGGAVYMNAGAYGGEIKDVILRAEAASRTGVLRCFDREQMRLSYRKSVFSDNGYTILSAEFRLKKGNAEKIKADMDELIGRRRDKQPLDFPSAGSTFKRPQGSYASLLIEQCGLKGLSVGGAQVSTKHSGFVINKGGATFDDVIALIAKVRAEVEEKTGYKLECEPVIISDRKEFSERR